MHIAYEPFIVQDAYATLQLLLECISKSPERLSAPSETEYSPGAHLDDIVDVRLRVKAAIRRGHQRLRHSIGIRVQRRSSHRQMTVRRGRRIAREIARQRRTRRRCAFGMPRGDCAAFRLGSIGKAAVRKRGRCSECDARSLPLRRCRIGVDVASGGCREVSER